MPTARVAAVSRPAGLRSTASPGGEGESAPLPSVESLAVVEVGSVPRGTVVADGVLKMAPVRLLFAGEISPGKFLVLFGGAVGPTRASHARGVELAGDVRVDDLLLPQLHPGVLPAIEQRVPAEDGEALGTLETETVAATIAAADRAAKAARIRLRKIRLAQGLGGRAFVYLTGALTDVEAAVAAGRVAAGDRLRDWSIVPRLHPQAGELLL